MDPEKGPGASVRRSTAYLRSMLERLKPQGLEKVVERFKVVSHQD
ncbi:MAG: hypothetical protein QXM98_01210 [Thermoproteota archaeon]